MAGEWVTPQEWTGRSCTIGADHYGDWDMENGGALGDTKSKIALRTCGYVNSTTWLS